MVEGSRERVAQRRWLVAAPASPELAVHLGVQPLWATLLQNRGITTSPAAQAFLNPPALSDPFLLPGMHVAVERLTLALSRGERIAVYGDFDADGVTACALLFTALKRLGGDVLTYLPHRSREGHGLNLDAIASLKAQGVSLIVTVDCGITAVAEVAAARALGIETIITDHHVATASPPPAVAMVTTTGLEEESSLQYLAGAGLSFKLAHALHVALGKHISDELLGLAAIGTVADLTPLLGENRSLVNLGLEALNRSVAPGILALCSVAGVRAGNIDARTLTFSLVPRINAAGRMDSAEVSFNLLTAESLEQARPIAEELERLNRQRQDLTNTLFTSALTDAIAQAAAYRLLFLSSEQFLPGTNGLLASRLVEQFHRPVIVVALGQDLAWASARSVPDFNLAEAFHKSSGMFVRFGGHAMAAGFTAQRSVLPDLLSALRETAEPSLKALDMAPHVRVDAETSLKSLVGPTFHFLTRMEPFGAGNPQPVFLTRGVTLVDSRRIGASGQHLMLKVRGDGALWTAMAFAQRNNGDYVASPRMGSRLDIVYTIERDTYSGQGALKLILQDYRTVQ